LAVPQLLLLLRHQIRLLSVVPRHQPLSLSPLQRSVVPQHRLEDRLPRHHLVANQQILLHRRRVHSVVVVLSLVADLVPPRRFASHPHRLLLLDLVPLQLVLAHRRLVALAHPINLAAWVQRRLHHQQPPVPSI
jgi:hypothetical protein